MNIQTKKLSRLDYEAFLADLGFPGANLILAKSVKGSILVVFSFQGVKISRFVSPTKLNRKALDRTIQRSKLVQFKSKGETINGYKVERNNCSCVDFGRISVNDVSLCKHTIAYAKETLNQRSIAQMIGLKSA